MALELFKPLHLLELENTCHASTIKSAKNDGGGTGGLGHPSEVVREYPILLNRAPTLHRLGIQAFRPCWWKARPSACIPWSVWAYNADFDGDQMAVQHSAVRGGAQIECRVLMMSTNNILSPANGGPVIVPSQDIVLGLYYMTVERSFEKGEGMTFCAPWEVEAAYDAGQVSLHARVKVRMKEGEDLVQTTPGRVLVSDILPPELSFEHVNTVLTKKAIAKLVGAAYRTCGIKSTVILCDKLKDMGYEFATRAGVTIGVKDLTIPESKKNILAKSQAEVDDIERQYRDGIITRTEKYNKVVDVWTKATQDVSTEMIKEISYDCSRTRRRASRKNQSFNPIFMMSNSGARGNQDQMRQLAACTRPDGQTVGRNHRNAHHLVLPRRALGVAVLHLHPRRAQGPGGHGPEDGQLRLPDPPPGGRGPGRDRFRARLRHGGRH